MRRTHGFSLVSFLLVGSLVGSGCGRGTPAPGTEEAVRDSAGIRIVQSAGEAPETWTVADTVSIGRVEGASDYTFNSVADVSLGPDGRVYVLDAGDNVVKVYAANGTYVSKLGGPGDGPQEFRRAARLIWAGDTLEVFDYRAPKLVAFADGRFVGTQRVALTVFQYGFPSVWSRIPHGWVAVFGTGCSMPRPEDLRPKWKMLVLDSAAAVRDTVTIRTNRSELAIYGQQFCSSTDALGEPRNSLAVRPDGLAAFGDGSTYQIALFRLRADRPGGYHGTMPLPELLIRREKQALPLSKERIATYKKLHMTRPDGKPLGRDNLDALNAAWDTVGFPAQYPYFDALVWDHQHRLWVGETPAEKATSQPWAVFDDQGKLLADVQLPLGVSVKAIANGSVWGTMRDSLGVTYVKGYRIEPRSPSETSGANR